MSGKGSHRIEASSHDGKSHRGTIAPERKRTMESLRCPILPSSPVQKVAIPTVALRLQTRKKARAVLIAKATAAVALGGAARRKKRTPTRTSGGTCATTREAATPRSSESHVITG